MKQYTYLFINFGCIIIPLLFSFYKNRAFYKEFKFFFLSNFIVALPFLIWDGIFTNLGVWGFNPDYLTGIYISNLPLEEILFFICIPYACTFLYFAMMYILNFEPLKNSHRTISYVLVIILILLSIFSWPKLYTSTTFIITTIFLIFSLIKKINLSYIYFSYFCIFPFFLISNGILTGSMLDQPIVWYDNLENLNIRLITIPIEDIVYGFLLIALNISLYEKIKEKCTSK